MLVKRGIILKSPREIELMREAGRVVRRVLSRCEELASPGVSSAELNVEAERIIAEAGGEALFKGVRAPKARFPPGPKRTSRAFAASPASSWARTAAQSCEKRVAWRPASGTTAAMLGS